MAVSGCYIDQLDIEAALRHEGYSDVPDCLDNDTLGVDSALARENELNALAGAPSFVSRTGVLQSRPGPTAAPGNECDQWADPAANPFEN
jgi:hypothetical protein